MPSTHPHAKKPPRPGRGGGFFRAEWFHYCDELPQITRWVRRWDFAATDAAGDWTAGGLMGLGVDGNYYLADVQRDRLTPQGVRLLICATAEADGPHVPVVIPEDPGQAGKDQVISYQREPRLQRFAVRGVRETGSKEVRAAPFASKCEAGMVYLLRAPWNREFVGELTSWNPADKNATDDQIDFASGAFAELTGHAPLSVGFI